MAEQEENDMKHLSTKDDLQRAYNESWYFVAGCGGDLVEWVKGYETLLTRQKIGKPVGWYRTTGAVVNEFAGASFIERRGNPFQPDTVCLLFPLDGLNAGRLAIFKLRMEDRWTDDVVDNMGVRAS
jgi:hypothetical protein